MIPRIIHRVVLPPLESTGDVAAYWEGFARLHPDWRLITWTRPSTEDFPETSPRVAWCGSPAQVADLMRVELLWRHGGIYVDADCEPVRALDPLLDFSFVIGHQGTSIATGVIGCEPRHPAIRAYLDALLALPEAAFRSLPPDVATGPRLAHRVLAGRPDVTVLHPVAFYAEPWTETMERRRRPASFWATEHTFVIHRWHESWKPPLSPYRRARRVARRYVAQPWRKVRARLHARRGGG